VIEDKIGQDSDPAHGRDRFTGFGDRHDVPRRTCEAARAQLGEEMPDLPVGKSVVDGQMCDVRLHMQDAVILTIYCQNSDRERIDVG
jgi:hypothetical protein